MRRKTRGSDRRCQVAWPNDELTHAASSSVDGGFAGHLDPTLPQTRTPYQIAQLLAAPLLKRGGARNEAPLLVDASRSARSSGRRFRTGADTTPGPMQLEPSSSNSLRDRHFSGRVAGASRHPHARRRISSTAGESIATQPPDPTLARPTGIAKCSQILDRACHIVGLARASTASTSIDQGNENNRTQPPVITARDI